MRRVRWQLVPIPASARPRAPARADPVAALSRSAVDFDWPGSLMAVHLARRCGKAGGSCSVKAEFALPGAV
jgi:hypothetical protein